MLITGAISAGKILSLTQAIPRDNTAITSTKIFDPSIPLALSSTVRNGVHGVEVHYLLEITAVQVNSMSI